VLAADLIRIRDAERERLWREEKSRHIPARIHKAALKKLQMCCPSKPLESTSDQSFLRSVVTLPVRTAWPAARAAHSFFEFPAYPLNVLPSGFRLLDGDNPADPLIAREWRNLLPFCPRCWVRNESFS
jgi:hypothetical protein